MPNEAVTMPPDVRREITSVRTKLLYGAGSIAFGVKDNGFGYFLLIFYNQVVGLPSGLAGLAIFVALLVDAFADPVIGQVSDNWRSRLGRRHPFMYAAAVPVALGYFFVWNPPHLSTEATFFYLVGISIAVRTVISLYEIPSTALVAELTPDYDQRTSFLSYRLMFAWLGGLAIQMLAYGVFLVATKEHPIGLQNPAGYAHYGLAASIIMLCAILISARGTQKFVPYFVQPPVRRRSLSQNLREMAQSLKNRSFIALTLSGLFSAIGAGTVASLNNYFNLFFWQLSSGQIFFFTLAVVISPIAANIITTPWARNMGKKRAAVWFWVLSTIFGWIPLIARMLGVFPANGSPWLLPLLVGITTVSVTFTISASAAIGSMMADVVEDSQRATQRRSEGLFFAANSFIAKAVTGVGIGMGSMLLVAVGFPSNANPATLDPAIPMHLALIYIPTVFIIYGIALFLLSFYRIDRAMHEENLKELAADVAQAPLPSDLAGPH